VTAKLVKRGGIAQRDNQPAKQDNYGRSATQEPVPTGMAAIEAEVNARLTASKRQMREQARRNFSGLFVQRS
jgi:hypothetical protein